MIEKKRENWWKCGIGFVGLWDWGEISGLCAVKKI